MKHLLLFLALVSGGVNATMMVTQRSGEIGAAYMLPIGDYGVKFSIDSDVKSLAITYSHNEWTMWLGAEDYREYGPLKTKTVIFANGQQRTYTYHEEDHSTGAVIGLGRHFDNWWLGLEFGSASSSTTLSLGYRF